jgi:hypothetical protein
MDMFLFVHSRVCMYANIWDRVMVEVRDYWESLIKIMILNKQGRTQQTYTEEFFGYRSA